MSATALLEEHVRRFNAGVRGGNVRAVLELFAPDAVLAFEGVPVGPFHGLDAIAIAYRNQPPDDMIDVLDVEERPDGIVAGYAWRAEPGTRAGEMRLTIRESRIERLVVTFGPP